MIFYYMYDEERIYMCNKRQIVAFKLACNINCMTISKMLFEL